jgi:hypothetical protein
MIPRSPRTPRHSGNSSSSILPVVESSEVGYTTAETAAYPAKLFKQHANLDPCDSKLT